MNQPAAPQKSVRRLLVAVLVGVVVTVVSYLGAFHFIRGAFLIYSPLWTTQHELRNIAATFQAHKERTGHYPTRLTDIEGLREALKHDAEGRPVDYWDHPIQYSATEDGFTLFSFGQDGQSGGEGAAADVYPDQPLELPSLYHFTFELPTGAIRWACMLTGIGAAVVVGRSSYKTWGDLLVRAVTTTVGAILIAFLISIVHIPSGH